MGLYSSAGKAILVTIGVALGGLCVVGIILIIIALSGNFDTYIFLGILGAAGGVPVWTVLVWLRKRLLRWMQGNE